jgi:hypothetical protein
MCNHAAYKERGCGDVESTFKERITIAHYAQRRAPPADPNHKRAASPGEAARLQKQKKWKAAAGKKTKNRY